MGHNPTTTGSKAQINAAIARAMEDIMAVQKIMYGPRSSCCRLPINDIDGMEICSGCGAIQM